MSPFQHGEVFVLEDGTETDLDLGHYERFINNTCTKKNNFTAGKIYYSVLRKERKGEYLGKTVQIIPPITDEIKRRIIEASKDCDIAIIEIGGTVGDIESQSFIEAIRQLGLELKNYQTAYLSPNSCSISFKCRRIKNKTYTTLSKRIQKSWCATRYSDLQIRI